MGRWFLLVFAAIGLVAFDFGLGDDDALDALQDFLPEDYT